MPRRRDGSNAERLSQDPTFRLIGSEKIWERGAALTSRSQTFETGMLAQDENFAELAPLWPAGVAQGKRIKDPKTAPTEAMGSIVKGSLKAKAEIPVEMVREELI